MQTAEYFPFDSGILSSIYFDVAFFAVVGCFLLGSEVDFFCVPIALPDFGFDSGVVFLAEGGDFFVAAAGVVGFLAGVLAGAGKRLGALEVTFGFTADLVPTADGGLYAGELELFGVVYDEIDPGIDDIPRLPPVIVSGRPRGLKAVGCRTPLAFVQSFIEFP